MRRLLYIIRTINVLKTIWFNFKAFSFAVAKKFPVWLYGKVTFRSLTGKVVINRPISSGMIKIGKNDHYVDTAIQQCIWNVRGTVIFNGPAIFGHGSYVVVSDNATLEFGEREVYLGTNLKIFCFDRIVIGSNVRAAWDCQFMDTTFHYVQNLNRDGEIGPLTKPIILGEDIWVGNRTTFSKGAVVPSKTIIASNSLVNKDFSHIEPYTMLAGMPASVKATGLKRIFDLDIQREMDEKYHYVRTHL